MTEQRRADAVQIGDAIEITLASIFVRVVASIRPVGKKMGTDIDILRFEFTVIRGIKALEVAADQMVVIAR